MGGKAVTKKRRGRREPPEGPLGVERHARSLTALAAEAMRLGASGRMAPSRTEAIPHEGRLLRCGDPDEKVMDAEYVGDDVPGGSTPTPDQNLVDEIGRAYGISNEDTGELRTSSEVLEDRDQRRWELTAPPRGNRAFLQRRG